MDHRHFSEVFERSFVRLKADLTYADPAAACCGWVSLYDIKMACLDVAVGSSVFPFLLNTHDFMNGLIIPNVLKLKRNFLFFEDLEINHSDEQDIMKGVQDAHYGRGVVASYVRHDILYASVLMINGLAPHTLSLLPKISFSFLDFFDVGIRHIENKKHAQNHPETPQTL